MKFTPPVRRRNHGSGHSYRDANDQKIPGVTTLIKEAVPPKLDKWAAEKTTDHAIDNWDELARLPLSKRRKELENARFDDLRKKSVRGTKVHAIAEKAVDGQEVDKPEDLAGHIDALIEFWNRWQLEPLHTEFTVVHYDVGYAGTADLIAFLPSLDQTWLLDYKTSEKGVYGDVALQLAAYRYAQKMVDATGAEVDMPEVDGAGVIWVRADGADLFEITAGPAQFRDFQYALQVGRFRNESRELISEPLQAPPLDEDVPA